MAVKSLFNFNKNYSPFKINLKKKVYPKKKKKEEKLEYRKENTKRKTF